MSVLTWDEVGQRFYETGVDHGVLYIPDSEGAYLNGYAWNGLVSVTESPTGAEATAQYADNIKYLNLISAEEFGGTIEAYTYPDEFAQCDGSTMPEPGITVGQQNRHLFGLSYRTIKGNDIENNAFGYKLHLVWGALAAPSEKPYSTVNDSPEAIAFSWEFTTTPVPVTGYKPTAMMTIDSTVVNASALSDLEDLLYGTVSTDPSLPTPDEVIALFSGTVTEVTPGTPTYDSGTDIVTIPSTAGVVYRVNGVVVPSGAYGPITANVMVTARPAAGYKFPELVVDEWLITFA